MIMSDVFRAVRSSILLSKAFKAVEREKDDIALVALDNHSFDVVERIPTAALSIQYDLLRLFMDYKYSEQLSSRKLIHRIRNSDFNSDEKKLLIKYALTLIWLFRGKPDCLKRRLDAINYDKTRISEIYLSRFQTNV